MQGATTGAVPVIKKCEIIELLTLSNLLSSQHEGTYWITHPPRFDHRPQLCHELLCDLIGYVIIPYGWSRTHDWKWTRVYATVVLPTSSQSRLGTLPGFGPCRTHFMRTAKSWRPPSRCSPSCLSSSMGKVYSRLVAHLVGLPNLKRVTQAIIPS
jgi:hypothetical protein